MAVLDMTYKPSVYDLANLQQMQTGLAPVVQLASDRAALANTFLKQELGISAEQARQDAIRRTAMAVQGAYADRAESAQKAMEDRAISHAKRTEEAKLREKYKDQGVTPQHAGEPDEAYWARAATEAADNTANDIIGLADKVEEKSQRYIALSQQLEQDHQNRAEATARRVMQLKPGETLPGKRAAEYGIELEAALKSTPRSMPIQAEMGTLQRDIARWSAMYDDAFKRADSGVIQRVLKRDPKAFRTGGSGGGGGMMSWPGAQRGAGGAGSVGDVFANPLANEMTAPGMGVRAPGGAPAAQGAPTAQGPRQGVLPQAGSALLGLGSSAIRVPELAARNLASWALGEEMAGPYKTLADIAPFHGLSSGLNPGGPQSSVPPAATPTYSGGGSIPPWLNPFGFLMGAQGGTPPILQLPPSMPVRPQSYPVQEQPPNLVPLSQFMPPRPEVQPSLSVAPANPGPFITAIPSDIGIGGGGGVFPAAYQQRPPMPGRYPVPFAPPAAAPRVDGLDPATTSLIDPAGAYEQAVRQQTARQQILEQLGGLVGYTPSAQERYWYMRPPGQLTY